MWKTKMWRNILYALFFSELSGNHSILFVSFCIAVNITAVIALLLVPAATISILLTLLSWWHKTKPFFKHIHCYQTVRSIMEKKIDAVIRVHTIDIPPQTTWMAELCFRCSFSWNVLGPTMLCFVHRFIYFLTVLYIGNNFHNHY